MVDYRLGEYALDLRYLNAMNTIVAILLFPFMVYRRKWSKTLLVLAASSFGPTFVIRTRGIPEDPHIRSGPISLQTLALAASALLCLYLLYGIQRYLFWGQPHDWSPLRKKRGKVMLLVWLYLFALMVWNILTLSCFFSKGDHFFCKRR